MPAIWSAFRQFCRMKSHTVVRAREQYIQTCGCITLEMSDARLCAESLANRRHAISTKYKYISILCHQYIVFISKYLILPHFHIKMKREQTIYTIVDKVLRCFMRVVSNRFNLKIGMNITKYPHQFLKSPISFTVNNSCCLLVHFFTQISN